MSPSFFLKLRIVSFFRFSLDILSILDSLSLKHEKHLEIDNMVLVLKGLSVLPPTEQVKNEIHVSLCALVRKYKKYGMVVS